MEEKYVKEIPIIEKTEIEKEEELIQSIIKTTEDLKNANNNFEFAEEELIEYYIYQIKAYQSKLNYLIKVAKKKGIELNGETTINYQLLEPTVQPI